MRIGGSQKCLFSHTRHMTEECVTEKPQCEKASSEVKEREIKREKEKEKEGIVTPARSEVSMQKVEHRPCQMFSFPGNRY